MIGNVLQPTHLIVLLVLLLLVFGPKRLPELGRSLGRGLRDFKTGIEGEESVSTEDDSDSTTPPLDP